jgi:hypothetical protein
MRSLAQQMLAVIKNITMDMIDTDTITGIFDKPSLRATGNF